MRWFEQAISKRRYHLTQFHRPAMLKLERLHNSGLQPVSEFILWHGFFIAWLQRNQNSGTKIKRRELNEGQHYFVIEHYTDNSGRE